MITPVLGVVSPRSPPFQGLGIARLIHIPGSGRRPALICTLVGNLSEEVVETASPCGETWWSEIPESTFLDTRGLTQVSVNLESSNDDATT